MQKDDSISVSIIWRGKQFVVGISSAACLKELGHELQKLTGVSEDTMRFLMPKSFNGGPKLSYPFSDSHSQLTLQEVSVQEGKPIRMMGASKDEIDDIIKNEKANLRIAGFEEEERRLKQRMLVKPQSSVRLPQGNYIFCEFRTLQLSGMQLNPPPSEALKRMHRLAADPGIVAIMNKHRWRVGIMSEMAPEGYVGISSVCVLGLNKNQGEEISLRLRTDDLKGFRKYEVIKKTLLHELAHMVYSEHDADFYALNSLLTKEASSLDWTRSRSHTLSGASYSTYYEDEYDMEDNSDTSQKVGGDTSGQLASARASSVAAAYNRYANSTVSLSEVPEIGLDGLSSRMREETWSHVDGVLIPHLKSDDELPLDNCCGNENETQVELEPNPDLSTNNDEMETEQDGDKYNEAELSARPKTTAEPEPDDAVSQLSSLGSLEDSLVGCYLSNQQKNSHEELDPDDSVKGEASSKSDSDPDPDDQCIISGNLGHHTSPQNGSVLLNFMHTEPDPDDCTESASRTVVSSNDPVGIDGYEPDPDDQELKRIQDPVMIFCSRLQKAVEMLRTEVKPGDFDIVIKTLTKIISNAIGHPNDMKYKRLRKGNPSFNRNVANYKASMEILSLIGFCEDLVSNDVGTSEIYMVLRRNDPGLLWLAKSSLDAYLL